MRMIWSIRQEWKDLPEERIAFLGPQSWTFGRFSQNLSRFQMVKSPLLPWSSCKINSSKLFLKPTFCRCCCQVWCRCRCGGRNQCNLPPTSIKVLWKLASVLYISPGMISPNEENWRSRLQIKWSINHRTKQKREQTKPSCIVVEFERQGKVSKTVISLLNVKIK